MSFHGDGDYVSIQIDQELRNLPDATSQLPSIFRVHDRLREENEDAYEPEVVSIGPYHHGKSKLNPMEKHKLRFLQQVLSRRCEDSAGRYVRAMRALEARARKCYALDPLDHLHSDEFVKMMLLDSCFIIELFRKFKQRENDPILRHVANAIFRDMKLLENQLPFFVLVEFMNKSRLNDDEEEGEEAGEDIIDMAFNALHITGDQYKKFCYVSPKDIDHLLDLLHQCWCYSFEEIQFRARSAFDNVNSSNKWEYIKPATELKEAGVRFKCAKERRLPIGTMVLISVDFENGVMELPRLDIDDSTEIIARNLIAYEQYLPCYRQRNVTDYYTLLDCLVNSSKDVEILRHNGIIHHGLGDDGVIAAMINKLTNHTIMSDDFTYSYVFYNVNEHCKRRRNVWIAKLKHTYFNTPWAWISFLAAVILLLLTVIQTTFSVLAYVAPKS